MATIVRRERKDGYAFLFQVKVKNVTTGEWIPKAKSWTPPSEMSAKQAEREAVILADAFEKEIRRFYSDFNAMNTLTPDSLYAEVAEAWLNKIRRLCNMEDAQLSFTYLRQAEDNAYRHHIPALGKMKMRSITPAIIQKYFDSIDDRRRTIVTARSKPEAFRSALKQRFPNYGIRTNGKLGDNSAFATLTRVNGISDNVFCNAVTGRANIKYESAKAVAEILNVNINDIFEITEKQTPYATRTNHHIKAGVRSVLAYATRMQLIDRNVARAEYVEYPKRKQKEIQCMDETQVARVLLEIANWTDIRQATALLAFIFTGFRRGEMCGLKWDCVDMENRLIHVKNNVTRANKYGLLEKDPKTEKSRRTVEIPQILLNQLAKYKAWYDKQATLMGDRWAHSGYVFVHAENGTRIAPEMFYIWINDITQKAGLGKWTVHSMRHTNITTKLRNNVPLLEVSADAGHGRTSTTTDAYGHFLKREQRRAPAVLDNIFQMPLEALAK